MKPFNLIPIIVFFCCCFLEAGAQEYSYKHYEIKDGLVGNNVYQSVEDKEGFLWFATETGVSRFDGTSFKNFTTAEGLPDNEILRLFVDSKGRVWMMPFKNAVCYYYKGKIYNTENDSTLHNLKINGYINHMFEDGDQNLVFLNQNELIVLQKNNNILKRSEENGHAVSFYGGGVNDRLAPFTFMSINSQPTHLYKIKIEPARVSFENETDSIIFWGNKTSYSYITSKLFVYSYNNLIDLKYSSLVFNDYIKHYSHEVFLPKDFNLISFLNDSLLCFNTNHGSLLYNYSNHVYADTFLENEHISCTIKDHEKNTWFTTLGNGIYRLFSEENKNISFIANGTANSIESIFVNEKSIIAGAGNSTVYKINKKDGQVASFTARSFINVMKLIKIVQHKDAVYVLGENSLSRFDAGLTKLTEIPLPGSGLSWSLKDMTINDSEKIFFATHMRIFSCLLKNNLTFDYDSILEGRATAICLADSGMYVGTLKGLIFINQDGKVVELGNKYPLLGNRITRLLFSKGKLWIGTNDQGVICFNKNKIEKNISVKNGLTGNLIRALFIDSNYLWVGTDRGLNKISLSDTSYSLLQKYTISDGIASDMINAVFVQNDTVYIGTAKGLSFFNENKINSNSTCDLRILGIAVSGKDIFFDSSKLFLQNKDNNIRFDFVAISFKSEGNILYYYKLTGIDTEWKTTRENFLQYPTLPSGQYNLELYAVNKFGVKSKPVTIRFEIENKLFEETWFIILVILAAVVIALLLASWRIRTIKRSQNEKAANAERIAKLEQQALKAQMNPHFIFNCLNSIQQYVIDKDVQGANKFISGFSKLIRQTLDNSGKQSISVAEEESFLRSYLELEKSRFEDKFDYNISIDKNIQKDEDSLPPMLLQPYIENCIRHGIMHKSNGKGNIDIRFNLSDGKLVCSISDNGIGRVAANIYKSTENINYQSKGTDITWQRIKIINKEKDADIILQTEDLIDSNQDPCGTKVTIVIPLQKAD